MGQQLTSLRMTFLLSEKALGGDSSLWSSQLASPSMEPLPYEQAGVRAVGPQILSLSRAGRALGAEVCPVSGGLVGEGSP